MNDQDDIKALFAAYGECFDDADEERLTSLFTYPATIWQFGKGHVFEDEDELGENAGALFDAFDEAGVNVTTPTVRHIEVRGASAMADVSWQQTDADGEVIHAFACQYFLLKQDAEWFIAAINNEEDE